MNHRAHIVIPQDLVRQIDSLVGKRGRSVFLVDAASRETVASNAGGDGGRNGTGWSARLQS